MQQVDLDIGQTESNQFDIDLTSTSIPPTPGGGIEEAPIDGTIYGRENGTWQNIDTGKIFLKYQNEESLDGESENQETVNRENVITLKDHEKRISDIEEVDSSNFATKNL